DRQMIAGRRLPARQHGVTPYLRTAHHRAGLAARSLALLQPARFAGAGAGRRDVEPQCRRPSGAGRMPVRWCRPLVARGPVGVARPRRSRSFLVGYSPRQFGSALETWIDEAESAEP